MSSEPTPTPAPARSLVGQTLSDRYRIKALLGEGGMGAVYLAEHVLMRKQVALKLLHADMSKDEEVLARFRREAEAAAHVEHPNVAAATDFGQTADGSFFLVLEYVEGTSLRDALGQGPIGTSRALHVARQIGLALERAHGAGIVHRDLKPENVMLVHKQDDPDFVKVLDFGIAKVEPHPNRDTTQPLTRMGTILGTPEYMAPEQALGEVVGPPADLYAVGVMLYEMLTGKHPFDASDRMAVLSMHIVAPVPAMSDRNPSFDVPLPVEELTRRLLEKDPKARPENARALVEAIDVAAGRAGVELPHATSSRSLGRASDPGPLPVSVVPSGSPAPPNTTSAAASWTPSDALAKTDYGIPAQRLEHDDEPLPLPGPLKSLPRNVGLAIVIGGPIFFFVIIVAVIFAARARTPLAGGSADSAVQVGAAEAPKPTRVSPERIRAAATQGVSALEELAREAPKDPAVQRSLALAYVDANRSADALQAIQIAAKLEPTIVDDALVLVVVSAAQRAETADAAFALLEGGMGARGVDGLVDLTAKSVPATTRIRATKSLAKPDVKALASPATSVLLDLKAATTCAARHELLDRAKVAGDARILPLLKSYKNARGCGFAGLRDCHPCMRKDDDLDDAIRAVEARGTK